ncbi:serine/threonine-protein kinase [Tumidithrix elongata RA019]|uniref:non-specific serine/threonine protein kinase n=1 Tax=Tumidithrix elongata BACA0141 TaxID=2716417 RepID=A0AAW9PXP0_9CYAN|nr:serine/threonine-protein kinase [Tumidithrix elongata RA019]
MSAQHHEGDIIAQKYRIINILGQGGMGVTYSALDQKTNQKVALKVMSLQRADDFKILELFEREAKILSQLNHPAIPRYLDYFQIDRPRDRLFYIVQQLADGQSLASLVEKGWKPNELEVKQIAEKVLEVLVYLQQLTPPVIHRDIKPQNIIYAPNGTLFLVDFGAVQDTYHNSLTGGSTVVGTYGFMAPEQFRGQANLVTDLYGLGTTLIFLLTQKAPSDLPQKKLKVNFRPHVQISKQFAGWIDRAIEPIAEDRFASTAEALAVLQGKQEFTQSTAKATRPVDSRITLIDNGERLIAEIPSVGLQSNYSRLFMSLPIAWNVILLLFILIVFVYFTWIRSTYSSIGLTYSELFVGLSIFVAFGLIGIWISIKFLLSVLSRFRLVIDPTYFHYQRWFLNFCLQDVKGETAHIIKADLKNSGLALFNRNSAIQVCSLVVKRKPYRFGAFLSEPEKQWLIAEIDRFLQKQKLQLNAGS